MERYSHGGILECGASGIYVLCVTYEAAACMYSAQEKVATQRRQVYEIPSHSAALGAGPHVYYQLSCLASAAPLHLDYIQSAITAYSLVMKHEIPQSIPSVGVGVDISHAAPQTWLQLRSVPAE